VRDLLGTGKSSFYESRDSQELHVDFGKRTHVVTPQPPNALHLRLLHQRHKIVRRNPGASLVDLGDGILCLEFHSRMNVIGADQLTLLQEALAEVKKNCVGLVIGNQGEHFSAGANLKEIVGQIESRDWAQIDRNVRLVQQLTSTFREFDKPVIVACHGYTLGGGCELALGADRVVAAAETYMGLPEVAVGVIPAAGGTKEMLVRWTEDAPRSEGTDYFPVVRQAWETIGLAKVSSSAAEAVQLKYLRPAETRIVLNGDWLIGAAKAQVLQRLAEGYRPRPRRRGLPAIGESGVAQFKMILHQMRVAGQISEFDQKLGEKLAWILCGGDLSYLHFVSEEYILDLEREAFLSLCGEPKTLERIQHMLKTGKPLRN
jgi:3-hydroxyacyl-CoA dehydrogenase